VIIELDHRRFKQAGDAQMTVVYGDARQEILLAAADIKTASLLILTVTGFVAARTVVVQSKRLNSRIEIVARTSGPDYTDLLKNLGASGVVLPEFEASLEMTRQALLRLRVPATEIQRHTEAVRQELYAQLFNGNNDYRVLSQLRVAEQQFDLQWVRLVPESPIAHQSIGDSELRKKTGASVVGIVREGQLKPNPDANFVLMPNDLIAIIGNERDREAFCLLAAITPCNVH
jgi:monovalent cation:H+ antiporter-2, CPA2 family